MITTNDHRFNGGTGAAKRYVGTRRFAAWGKRAAHRDDSMMATTVQRPAAAR